MHSPLQSPPTSIGQLSRPSRKSRAIRVALHRRATCLVALVLLGLLFALKGQSLAEEPARWASFERTAMATRFSVTLAEPIDPATIASFDAIIAEVERDMNEWRPESALAALNRGAGSGEWVDIPHALASLLTQSIQWAEHSQGAFDPTWAALWGLWDFTAAEPKPPEPSAIARQLAMVGYSKLHVELTPPRARLTKAGAAVGLGAIAKGYALDRMGEAFRRLGVQHALIDAGGQVFGMGSKDGRPWRVGIRDPRGEADDYFAVMGASDVSVSTSGDYERWFVVGDQRFHHILDPRTGWPSRGCRSATVVSTSGALADAFSTALMVLGVEAGLALIEKTPGAEALMVDDKGHVHISRGLRGRVRMNRAPHQEPPLDKFHQ